MCLAGDAGGNAELFENGRIAIFALRRESGSLFRCPIKCIESQVKILLRTFMPRVFAHHFGMDTFNIFFRADVYRENISCLNTDKADHTFVHRFKCKVFYIYVMKLWRESIT